MRNELVLRVQLWYNKFEICGGETEEPIPKQVYAFLPMPEEALAGYISSRTRRAGRGAFAPLSGGQRDRRSGDGPAGRFRRNDGIRRRGKTRYPFHAEKYEEVSHRGEREYLRSAFSKNGHYCDDMTFSGDFGEKEVIGPAETDKYYKLVKTEDLC